MTPRVEIVRFDGRTLQALATGDLAAANARSPIPLGPAFTGPDWRPTWQIRAAQVLDDPAALDWITGAVWDPDRGVAVGSAGFHGPPDERASVEIGYAIAPDHRRRGYARAAVQALLAEAAAAPDVAIVRVSIRPDNVASFAVVAPFGFERVGLVFDEDDGAWETVLERPAGQPPGW